MQLSTTTKKPQSTATSNIEQRENSSESDDGEIFKHLVQILKYPPAKLPNGSASGSLPSRRPGGRLVGLRQVGGGAKGEEAQPARRAAAAAPARLR